MPEQAPRRAATRAWVHWASSARVARCEGREGAPNPPSLSLTRLSVDRRAQRLGLWQRERPGGFGERRARPPGRCAHFPEARPTSRDPESAHLQRLGRIYAAHTAQNPNEITATSPETFSLELRLCRRALAQRALRRTRALHAFAARRAARVSPF